MSGSFTIRKSFAYDIAAFLLAMLLFGCTLPGQSHNDWSLSGNAVLQGVPSDRVLLAAFYSYEYTFYDTSQGSTSYPAALLVSDVSDQGTTGNNFMLHIVTSQLNLSEGQFIELIMWIDTNANSLYDAGEEWQYVQPRSGDPAFKNAIYCGYYYSDHANALVGSEPGWNQSVGILEYVPIHRATLTGALIVNDFVW